MLALPATLLTVGACSEPRFQHDDAGGSLAVCDAECDAGRDVPVGAPDLDSGATYDAGSGARDGRTALPSADADLGSPPMPAQDGAQALGASGTSGDAGLPDQELWKRQLEGSYVLRYRSYAREQTLGGLAVVASVQHSLATIAVDDAGSVTLTTRLCDDRGELTVPVAKTFIRAANPTSQPPRTFRLLYEDGTFRTEGEPSFVGYNEAVPAGCNAGGKLPPRSDQPWIRTQCDCPSSDLPPTSPSDCRLTDSDGDGHPGYTLQLSGFVQGQDYCRLRDASQLVAGRIMQNGRHTATLVRITDFFQIACEGNSCTRANGETCPGVMNVAEFVRLPATISSSEDACAEVMAQVNAGVYYSDNPLAVPSGC
jgi:hypothetical protein